MHRDNPLWKNEILQDQHKSVTQNETHYGIESRMLRSTNHPNIQLGKFYWMNTNAYCQAARATRDAEGSIEMKEICMIITTKRMKEVESYNAIRMYGEESKTISNYIPRSWTIHSHFSVREPLLTTVPWSFKELKRPF